MRARAAVTLTLALAAVPARAPAASTADVLGATHIAGRYAFTEEDYLNEGADRLLGLGTRVIKVWLSFDPKKYYPFHSAWGRQARTLVETASTPYFRDLFAKPFTTYILVVNTGSAAIDDGFTAADAAEESSRTYELAAYLLRTYRGSGKTFVLQNWEGDHILRAHLADTDTPDPARVRAMIDWFNVRQQAVERARREASDAGVTVAHAVEVNFLTLAMRGGVTLTNDVLPYVRPDLVSYSSWDVQFDPNRLVRALDYLGAHTRTSGLYRDRAVYLGEYGVAQEQLPPNVQQPTVIRELTESALGWGARWVVYWQLYSNESAREYSGRPRNADLRSLWLIPPDGRRTAMWHDFARRMPLALVRAALFDPSGRALSASSPADGGDGAVVAYSRRVGPWSTFAIHGERGSVLHDGDRVTLQTHDGRYVEAAADGDLVARDRRDSRAQAFVVRRLAGPGELAAGDAFRLATPGGEFLSVDATSTRVRLDAVSTTLRFLSQDDAASPQP